MCTVVTSNVFSFDATFLVLQQ